MFIFDSYTFYQIGVHIKIFKYSGFVSRRSWLIFRNERHRLIKQLSDVIGNVQTFDGNKLHLPFQLTEQVCYL